MAKSAKTGQLASPLAMSPFVSRQAGKSIAGRLQFVMRLLQGEPLYDEDGEPTGEYGPGLITKEQAAKLLGQG